MWIKFKQYYRDEVYEIDPDEESKRLVHDVWNRINPDWDISNMHESIWSYGNAADMYWIAVCHPISKIPRLS